MLVTRQPLLRRFWYCIARSGDIDPGPLPRTILGTPVVLWRSADGSVSALRDRCCHRTARLSKGWVEGETLVCGYHGWAYETGGQCVRIPQQKNPDRAPRFGVEAFRCAERYGHVWVCLGEPLFPLPEIPEADAPGFRRIDEFDEVWACAPLRILENSFDNAHFTFVHRATFGDPDPTPQRSTIEPFDGGFTMHTEIRVRNPADMRGALGIDEDWTVRRSANTWWMPSFRAGRITYPNGLVHVLVSAATPVDDGHTRFIQWVLRNDTEDDAPAEQVVAFDRRVTLEDKDILEATDPDVPLDGSDGTEFSMPSDKPGLAMRRMLAERLAAHGEAEARR